MTTISMTSRGQLTVPAKLRARLKLTPGSKFRIHENARGEIVISLEAGEIGSSKKTGDIRRLRGILKYDGPPVAIEDMSILRTRRKPA